MVSFGPWLRATTAAACATALAAAAPPAPLPFRVSGMDGAALDPGHVIASEHNDWINDLAVTGQGTVTAVGFVGRRDDPPSDWRAFAADLAADGAMSEPVFYGGGGGLDAFFALLEARDGRRVYAGFTTRAGNGGIDAWSLIASADGTILKENAHGTPGYDRFTDVVEAPDGLVFLGHSQAAGSDKRRVYVVKTDREGLRLWERIHEGEETLGALNIEPLGDGYIVSGGTAAGGDRDMFVMRLDADGRASWRRNIGTQDWNEVNHGLIVRPTGEIVLIGYTHRRGGEANDIVAATLSPTGELVRLERWGGQGDDRAIQAKLAADGRIWIIGHSASAGAGGDDLVVTALDAGGRFAGHAVLVGTSAIDRGTAILPLDARSLMIAGYSTGLGRGGEDAFVARLSLPERRPVHPAFRREVVQPR